MANIRGLAFPIELTATGGLKLAEDEELIASHIRMLLATNNLERTLQPQFGTPPLVFQPLNAPEILAERLRIALITQIGNNTEFDVYVDEVDSDIESGAVVVNVDWSIEGQVQSPLKFVLAE